jgi:hypothetical protein
MVASRDRGVTAGGDTTCAGPGLFDGSGRVALVTGSSRGIGRAPARAGGGRRGRGGGAALPRLPAADYVSGQIRTVDGGLLAVL